eukprot:TRINITY_DN12088_c0_g1_i2.p1 TRINITY_DN12088_c0_g1~~TRINITY_DN12088_c0_g1_i2.p1  ORF type:complete len:581 (+),score=187.08 TRINITY_DN12088_c0_g1_i2:73-1815(+)
MCIRDSLWIDTGITSSIVSKLRPYQKVNHFQEMSCLSRKNHLGKNMMRIRKLLPDDYDFVPQTWILPAEEVEFKAQFDGVATFIMKPEASCQGRGIFLINSYEEINPTERFIAQKYIQDPYLIEGLKFDLRIYVLVYGCDPLRIFVYKDGLVRLATEQYVPPSSKTMENMYIHLTNYAINKTNDKFVFNTDATKADVGHKRSLGFVWSYIDEHGGDSLKLRQEIKHCIVKTLCGVQPLLRHAYRSLQPSDNANNRCFEVLGFDIMLDKKLKPWLIEVNHTPSFSTDTPFDHRIKTELLTDTIRILNIRPMKRLKFHARRSEKLMFETVKKSKAEIAGIRKRKMDKRDKYELESCGGYERIYPANGNEAEYEKYIRAAQEVWDSVIGTKRGAEMYHKKLEMERKKKKGPVKFKSSVKPPVNRKPLYYINVKKAPRRKIDIADLVEIQMSLAAVGYDTEVQELVLRKLISRIESKEVPSEDVPSELPLIPSKTQTRNRLITVELDEIMSRLQESFPQLEIVPANALESSRGKYRRESSYKKLVKPSMGSYVVPKTFQLDPFGAVGSEKAGERGDKAWKYKKN